MKQAEAKFASVRVYNEENRVLIPISSNKPEIPEQVQQKWQKIVDLAAKIMKVPTGLITHLTEENLEIFVASQTKGNPYSRDDRDSLGIGMFCETVAGRQKPMLVQNTADEEYWRTNPHAKLGMHSYLGVPIIWDDGELFGTFCMLNDQSNLFTDDYMELMLQFKDIIETDLKNALLNEELKEKLSVRDMMIREVHHRTKNHFNLLISFINLQSRNMTQDSREVLTDIQNRIQAIAMVHEKLYSRENASGVLLDDYITNLVDIILGNLTEQEPYLVFEIDDVEAAVNISVPVGLIISELISNSLKYAFSGKTGPEIRIMIRREDKGTLMLEYSDNGPGYPDAHHPEHDQTIGIKIVRVLCEQLGGTAEFLNRNGAMFRTHIAL
ncbi:MAG: GAF domain-containing protein [Spirochaetales bacterium]|nr:GAF domain-containing protein [Spirochaetales bacterium]